MKTVAWIAFGLAVFAGAGLAADVPRLVQVVIVAAAITLSILDIVKNWEPNQMAVIVAVALPSLIVGMGGKFAEKLTKWDTKVWDWASGPFGEWAGTTSTIVIAGAAITISFIAAQRSMGAGSSSLLGSGGRGHGRGRY